MFYPEFYSLAAEWTKILFYVAIFSIIGAAYWRSRKQGDTRWIGWVHTMILIHFIVGAFYSGIRMLTTDPVEDMLIRRIFACEAWFCFAVVAFYFLGLMFLREKQQMSR